MTETISRADIDRVKREFILDNTLLTPGKVAEILSYSVRKVYYLIDAGELTAANDTPARKGLRITARSVEQYKCRCVERASAHGVT
ncbi:helix-turn-helix domain-containing protein [Syntrophotalea acetylenica]|uniref:Helix-turn-helix domain-containing protein n=1 Tax=Syntrophotalea acetylenica TaxID=29542 RepID=A0A1L3GDR0_SYNAC|nr:helix-turn-helix domain-containing protein [Syntrophotalea acetylenica]APG24094.1 hypothetical protein A7E75_02900 [Syntrophotalea acetylenica]APG44676.1 hypothetical protein A6070_11525 [Syntrophotalea acetylenica]